MKLARLNYFALVTQISTSVQNCLAIVHTGVVLKINLWTPMTQLSASRMVDFPWFVSRSVFTGFIILLLVQWRMPPRPALITTRDSSQMLGSGGFAYLIGHQSKLVGIVSSVFHYVVILTLWFFSIWFM